MKPNKHILKIAVLTLAAACTLFLGLMLLLNYSDKTNHDQNMNAYLGTNSQGSPGYGVVSDNIQATEIGRDGSSSSGLWKIVNG